MSHFDKETRDKARQKGAPEDFVKVTAGESMQFRVTKIGKVRNVPDAPNGPFDCLPFEVEVRWHKDYNGRRSEPEGFRWEPAADKCEGLIDIADRLESLTGNPDAIFEHDLIVNVTTGRSKAGRTFHSYDFEKVGPWPERGASSSSSPAPARTSTPAASSPASSGPAPAKAAGGPAPATPGASAEVTPEQFAATLRHAFAGCGNLETLEKVARERWPDAQRAKATAQATAEFKRAKIEVVGRQFKACTDVFELEIAWRAVASKFENDPQAFEAISVAYREREAAFYAAPADGFPGDDLPFPG